MTIRLVHLSGSPEIGDKRNFGCSLAEGDIIVHWDDDDFSAPGRIEDQVQRLVESGKSVTGYRSMRFTDGQRWWLYEGVPNYALGTSLCFRKAWWEKNRFPSLQVGEDNHMVANADAQRQLISVPAGDLMWATIHPGNTSPRDLGSSWKTL